MKPTLCLILALAASGLLRAKETAPLDQQYTAVDVSTSHTGQIGYGSTFGVTFTARKKNGKIRSISPKDKRFRIEVTGGKLDENTVRVTNYPETLGLYAVKVKITQQKRRGTKLTDSLICPIDFRRNLTIDFSGTAGTAGADGNGRWLKAVIGRDGMDGRPGEDGTNGSNGKNLEINVVSLYSKALQSPVYTLEVIVRETGKTYYYNWIENPGGITIKTHGGSGGDGGEGGKGGNGKDGEYIESKDKYKDAGAGGNGGNGGDGGNGGNGGNIDLFTGNHVEILNFIQAATYGGYEGLGGFASERGGMAGSALEGQHQPANGAPGQNGYNGTPGKDGYYRIHRE